MNYRDTQHPEFAKWIHTTLNVSGQSILDLGCGTKWYYPFLDQCAVTSVDIWEAYEPDILLNISIDLLPFITREFDIVLMFDVIEHLSRAQGKFALSEARRVCNKELYLLTPVIWMTNEDSFKKDSSSLHYGNTNNLHQSLWDNADFPKRRGWEKIKAVFNSAEYVFCKWSRS